MRLRAGILLCMVLFFLATASAVWVPHNSELIHEGSQINVDGYLVKFDVVDPDEQMVYVTVKQGTVVRGKGAVFMGEPLEIGGLFRVYVDSFSPVEYYGKQATVYFETWAEGKISFSNFPNHMNYNSRYDVYAVVENTGSADANFIVELTEPGNFERSGRIYQTDEYQTVNELIKVDRPLKFVTVPGGESRRVDWLIGPNRRQNSRTDSIVKVGDVQFNLYAADQLIDSITINSVKASTEQSAYISDVFVPIVMIKDVTYDAYTIVQNAGDAQGGVNSDRFLFRVSNPEFDMYPSLIREDIQSHTSDEWGFTLRADTPGQHLLTFTLGLNNPFNIGEKTLDTFTVPVTVLDGFTTRIAQVTAPNSVALGDTFRVSAIIENIGGGRQLDLVAEAPIFTEIAKQAKLSLIGNTVEPISFAFEATTTGSIPVTFTLYDKTGSKENINIDPYTRGKIIDTKTVMITVPEPGSESAVKYTQTPSTVQPPAGTTESLPVPQPVAPAPTGDAAARPSAVDTFPDTIDSTDQPTQWTYIGLLIGGILVLLLIVILIIANEFTSNPRKR